MEKIAELLICPLYLIIVYFYIKFLISIHIVDEENKQERKIENLEKEVSELKEIQKESLIKLSKRESVLKYIIESDKIAIADKKDDAIKELVNLYK